MNNYIVWIPLYPETNNSPSSNTTPQVIPENSIEHQNLIQGRLAGLWSTVEAASEAEAIARFLQSIPTTCVKETGETLAYPPIKTRIIESYF